MNEKEELIDSVQSVMGYLPDNIRNLLAVLVQPDVIEATKAYISVADTASHCLNYNYPWSCIKEAEARYKNIKYGWLGGASGIGLDESWCETCRRKVLDD